MNTKKKLKIVNSNKFGLSDRTILGVDNKNNHYIIKNIKSRIIMETGKKINEIANKIRFKIKGNVILATTAPVCSKTKKYLKEKKINIIFDYIIS
jgi:hypothetical protein